MVPLMILMISIFDMTWQKFNFCVSIS